MKKTIEALSENLLEALGKELGKSREESALALLRESEPVAQLDDFDN